MRVLELGNFIVPAYAGMLLREQGAAVIKVLPEQGEDPCLSLRDGAKLWKWLNEGKTLVRADMRTYLNRLLNDLQPDVVIENIRPSTWDAWGIDPAVMVRLHSLHWVGMRDEMGERSFDILAQMRSWAEYGIYAPFYVGDTAAGLFLAFKALALYATTSRIQGVYFQLGQASCLQKLVEGELLFDPPGKRAEGVAPWDEPGTYYFDREHQEGVAIYKGTEYREPVRDSEWKRTHLWHIGGRIVL